MPLSSLTCLVSQVLLLVQISSFRRSTEGDFGSTTTPRSSTVLFRVYEKPDSTIYWELDDTLVWPVPVLYDRHFLILTLFVEIPISFEPSEYLLSSGRKLSQTGCIVNKKNEFVTWPISFLNSKQTKTVLCLPILIRTITSLLESHRLGVGQMCALRVFFTLDYVHRERSICLQYFWQRSTCRTPQVW